MLAAAARTSTVALRDLLLACVRPAIALLASGLLYAAASQHTWRVCTRFCTGIRRGKWLISKIDCLRQQGTATFQSGGMLTNLPERKTSARETTAPGGDLAVPSLSSSYPACFLPLSLILLLSFYSLFYAARTDEDTYSHQVHHHVVVSSEYPPVNCRRWRERPVAILERHATQRFAKTPTTC